MTSDGVYSYSYDAEGNRTKKTLGASADTWTSGYDHNDQMTWAEDRATDGGTLLLRLDEKYDVFGRRIEEDRWTQATGTVVTHFGYDDSRDVWADLDSNNALQTRYVRQDGPDTLAARETGAGTVSWYGTDREGSVRLNLSASGALLNRNAYDAYGQRTSQTSPSNGDRFAYTGAELQSDLGAQLHDLRWYDPRTGRWTSEDLIGFAAGDYNLGRYVGNGPTNATDPSGLEGLAPGGVSPVEADLIEGDPGKPIKPNPNAPPPGVPRLPPALVKKLKDNPAASLTQQEYDQLAKFPDELAKWYRAKAFKGQAADITQYLPAPKQPPLPPRGKRLGEGLRKKDWLDHLYDKEVRLLGGAGTALQHSWQGLEDRAQEWWKSLVEAKGNLGEALARQLWKEVVHIKDTIVALPDILKQIRKEFAEDPVRATGYTGVLILEALLLKKVGGKLFGKKGCFPAGTPVHTAVGLKAIEQIAVGDRVWAYDHRQLRWAEREVVEVYQLQHQGPMATLQVKGETLRATGGHPFWVVRGEGLAERPLPVRIAAYVAGGRQEGRWVLARDLRAGDEVLLRHGEVVALESVRVDDVEERVYNFQVAELQNYAVGGCGILVHNTSKPTPPKEPAPFGAAPNKGQIGQKPIGNLPLKGPPAPKSLPRKLQKVADRIKAPGKYDATVGSLDEARQVMRAAMPDAVELPPAVAGKPYPSPPAGVKKWFQVQPPEPGVGNHLPHIKYADWTGGKKGKGGSWGHIFFPPAGV